MINYIIRRALYAIPILIGVNILVFLLFFVVNTPKDIARKKLGDKSDNPTNVADYLRLHDLDLPHIYNPGWTDLEKRINGAEKTNQRQFTISQAGVYRIAFLPATLNKNEVRQTNSLKLNLLFADSKNKSNLPKIKFTESHTLDASGQLCFSLDHSSQTPKYFQFTVPKPANQKEETTQLPSPLLLKVTFTLDQPFRNHSIAFQYKKPYPHFWGHFTDTLYAKKSLPMLFFNFGTNDKDINIGQEISDRMWPSLTITLPALVFGSLINIIFAMLMAVTRGSATDYWGVMLCVILMSISSLFYIIGGQHLFGKILHLTPISGYDIDNFSFRFVLLPIAVLISSGIGTNTRFYRTLFLEEINRDYIRTAKAKGMKQSTVLFVHTLKNTMIPILTGLVVQLPLLLIGSLLIEKFFAIPGLGSYTIDAIHSQDFSIVQAMVMLGAALYVFGLLLTDISYTLVDPRVRL